MTEDAKIKRRKMMIGNSIVLKYKCNLLIRWQVVDGINALSISYRPLEIRKILIEINLVLGALFTQSILMFYAMLCQRWNDFVAD